MRTNIYQILIFLRRKGNINRSIRCSNYKLDIYATIFQ